MRNVLLSSLLLCGFAAVQNSAAQTPTAQISVMNIPALPPGVTAAPKPTAPAAPTSPAPTTPAPVTPAPANPASATSTPAAPTVTTLPTGKTPLEAAYTVSLQGPDMVKAGEAQTWDFVLTNTGNQTIHLEHGACAVRFEVLNAAGEVVRPDPKNSICTMQLVITDAQPGEQATMQKIRWEGKDGQGQPVPAGTYTLRAKFVSGDVFTVPATREVTVQ